MDCRILREYDRLARALLPPPPGRTLRIAHLDGCQASHQLGTLDIILRAHRGNASYLLGDSVLQFSTIIGCYLFAMGIGSALSRTLIVALRTDLCGSRCCWAGLGAFGRAGFFWRWP